MLEQKQKQKKKKEKPKYSIFQNIGYALGNIWKWDRAYYLAFLPQIPLNVFLPLAAVYFPKVLIGLIEQKSGDAQMLAVIGGYCLILAAAGVVKLFCDARINATSYVFSFHYQNLCAIKDYTMDYENRENPKVSDMMNHTYEGGMAGEYMPKELNALLVNLLGIFTYGAIIGTLNSLILILLVVSTLINYAVLAHVRNYTEKNKDNWVRYDRKNGYLHEISRQYEHAKDIKLYGMRKWLLDLTVLYQNLRMKWHDKTDNKNVMAAFVDGGLRFARDGAAYAVLIAMLLDRQIDLGGFVFYFGAIAGFSGWLSSVIGQFNSIVSHSVNIGRLRAYLEVEDRFNRGAGAALPTASDIPYEIEFKNLSYTYPEAQKPAIDDISFKIEKGERLAIVGENGAGKTTLVKLLCGLYYPTSGSVLLDGKNAKEYNIDEYYTQFSAVFQEIRLMPVPIVNYMSGSYENVDREKAYNALKLAGLDTAIDKLPNGMDTTLVKGIYDDGIDLSGGEKQKLMLARALYKDAPVVVLDEPTAALDPIAENEIYMKYADLTKGKTSVYISHRLSSTRFCDRIMFIQDGKIAESGSHAELMEKGGLYANMFEIQSHYYKEGAHDGEK